MLPWCMMYMVEEMQPSLDSFVVEYLHQVRY